MAYIAKENRYEGMIYRRCGRSGLTLPVLSLGLWHNFGNLNDQDVQKDIICTAFDKGITYFDLADNYGPPYGEAERNFGRILKKDLGSYRDELIISTKAGYDMWPGPYGDLGSRKHLLAGIDQSLKRLGLEYVDIFYHHRPDYETPLEETALALQQIVCQGKALYVGVSNYKPAETKRMADLLRELKVPFVVHQPNYSMLDRWIEDDLADMLISEGIGAVVYKPLEQGLLTGKYLNGIPEDSRIRRDPRFLHASDLSDGFMQKVRALSVIAGERGQTMAQMALAWTLQNPCVTSAIIGASRAAQIVENVDALKNLDFAPEEMRQIHAILSEGVKE